MPEHKPARDIVTVVDNDLQPRARHRRAAKSILELREGEPASKRN